MLLFTGGCLHVDSAAEEQKEESLRQLSSRIIELEKMNRGQQEKMEELNTLIQLKYSQLKELETANSLLQDKTSMMDINLQVLQDLVHQTIDFRTAIYNGADIKGDQLELNITYADMVQDEDSPNGFYLKESEVNDLISINNNVPIYLLNRTGNMYPQNVQWEEVVELGGGFLKLYEKNGEVIFIIERYLP
ncbi:hypothetical protein ACFSCX_11335 [Bacillus salitolerans]|uniref:Uncharacterized protein n=1 Tax=Bacillus salitolerans TaxID=1437434 RepID=A0ABW4LSR3_9BACI